MRYWIFRVIPWPVWAVLGVGILVHTAVWGVALKPF
jgi:hypothetical protein